MKIRYKDSIYCLPEGQKMNFLIDNVEKRKFISCLYEFFGKKKKGFCQVFNIDGKQILCDEIDFIYFPYQNSNIENNFNLKPKSIFNIELTNFVNHNPERFQSIDRIRECLHEFLSDSGSFCLNKILSKGISTGVGLCMDEFNTSKIIEMFKIDQKDLEEDIEYMIVYNLLLYLNKNKSSIVYIDFPITMRTIKWLQHWNEKDLFFLIDNNFMEPCYSIIKECSLVKFSNKDFIERFELDIDEFKYLIYTFHPFVQQNIDLQNKKIINYFHQFNDISTTFYLTFSDIRTQNS